MDTIDRDRRPALPDQLAAILRRDIAAGKYRPGYAIPSGPVLARTYGVALVTARRAVVILAQEGLVEAVKGRGTYVREDPAA
jgi:GntR family transcriptional regulator